MYIAFYIDLCYNQYIKCQMREIPASQLREGILRMLSDKNKLPYAPSERRPRHTPQTSEYTDYYKHGGLRRVSGDLLRDADESRGEPRLLARAAYAVPGVLSLGYLQKERSSVYLITIAVNLVLFPLMYMLNGGVYSGMPSGSPFGLAFPWFAMDGRQVLRDVRT